jgi:hypothetical protein
MHGLFDPVAAVTAGGEQAAESVPGEVADSAGGFDDAVDGFVGPSEAPLVST